MSSSNGLVDLLAEPILDFDDISPSSNWQLVSDESSHQFDGNNSDQSLLFDTTTTSATTVETKTTPQEQMTQPAMVSEQMMQPTVVLCDDMTPEQQLYQQQLLKKQQEFFFASTRAPDQQQQEKESFTASWREWDVPLGRCQEVREHIGNVRFRSLVDEHRAAYLKAGRRSEKSFISSKVYSIIKDNGGRFLDRGSKSSKKEWIEISEDKALAKISQALRTGTRPVRKHSATSIQESKASGKSTNTNRSKSPVAAFTDEDLISAATKLPSFARAVTSESVDSN